MDKSIKINDIKRETGLAILGFHPTHKQLNSMREALVSLIERIPVEQRTPAETALIAQDSQINGVRARSNELEALAAAAQTEQELAAIEISF